jgi:hypothetical protein
MDGTEICALHRRNASGWLGVPAILAIGLTLGAVCLQMRQESWSYPEAVG